jgi:hypothetical protein
MRYRRVKPTFGNPLCLRPGKFDIRVITGRWGFNCGFTFDARWPTRLSRAAGSEATESILKSISRAFRSLPKESAYDDPNPREQRIAAASAQLKNSRRQARAGALGVRDMGHRRPSFANRLRSGRTSDQKRHHARHRRTHLATGLTVQSSRTLWPVALRLYTRAVTTLQPATRYWQREFARLIETRT